MNATDALLQRFWSKVDQSAGPDACWPWTGAQIKGGYGHFSLNRTNVMAHRLAYELSTGVQLGEFEIDHTCYITSCCNPGHLRPATRKQNVENSPRARSNSSTGVRGVYPSSTTALKAGHGPYCAAVTHHGARTIVGYFDTVEEAGAAVKAKRCELFTHNDADRDTDG